MSSQAEVDAEAIKWGREWACNGPRADIVWPVGVDGPAPLPELTVGMLRLAAHIFPARTGLGWDKLHPRAIC
eukprot:3458200-Heterocapsa_arctica.AAC.1